jgi:protein N-terminal methyltransferase
MLMVLKELTDACRSDKAWKECFQQAGLELLDDKVQEGLPEGLYEVKM